MNNSCSSNGVGKIRSNPDIFWLALGIFCHETCNIPLVIEVLDSFSAISRVARKMGEFTMVTCVGKNYRFSQGDEIFFPAAIESITWKTKMPTKVLLCYPPV